jgi:hypothetical protein
MQHMRVFRSDSVIVVSVKMLGTELRFAGGIRKRRFWMSCRSMKRFSVFRTAGIKAAMDSALFHELEPDLRVRVVNPVYFCATKLEAFAGRGKGDYQSSHDLEDLIAVVDGRSELANEILAGPKDVRAYTATEISKLLENPAFLDALPGYLLPDQASQARVSILLKRLKTIAAIQPGPRF